MNEEQLMAGREVSEKVETLDDMAVFKRILETQREFRHLGDRIIGLLENFDDRLRKLEAQQGKLQ